MNVSRGAAVSMGVIGTSAILGKGIGMMMTPKNDGFTRHERGVAIIATAVGAGVGAFPMALDAAFKGVRVGANVLPGMALMGAAAAAGAAMLFTNN